MVVIEFASTLFLGLTSIVVCIYYATSNSSSSPILNKYIKLLQL